MRLHESWRLNFLVKELATDILDVILYSPLDTIILCDIHDELFKDLKLSGGELVEKCKNIKQNISDIPSERVKRSVEEELPPLDLSLIREEETSQTDESNLDKLQDKLMEDKLMEDKLMETETEVETDNGVVIEVEDDQAINKDLENVLNNQLLTHKIISLVKEGKLDHDIPYKPKDQKPPLAEDTILAWKELCKKMCKSKNGNEFCPCKQLGSGEQES